VTDGKQTCFSGRLFAHKPRIATAVASACLDEALAKSGDATRLARFWDHRQAMELRIVANHIKTDR
jgi:hypothetical protein